MLTDLSPSITENADTVLFLYRDEVYFHDSPDIGIMHGIVAKSSIGQIGAFPMEFDGERSLVRDRTHT
jgi:replicative DNA helicase